MSSLIVYFYGDTPATIVKVGKTDGRLADRRKEMESGQYTAKVNFHLLAAVRAIAPWCETRLVGKRKKGGYFNHLRADVSSTETFRADPELTEYVNWLRQQPYTWHDEAEGPDEVPDWCYWEPSSERRVPLIPVSLSESSLFGAEYDSREFDAGPLVDTAWKSMSLPQPKHNDYYTPPSIVREAAEVMGGIDLDVASNWTANKKHKIPLYYHAHRSAFHNPWFGNVWMNPPYGENGAWFAETLKYLKSGEVKQICIFGQISALVTRYAIPLKDFKPSLLLFNPTPTFWGCNKAGEMIPPERCETENGRRLDSKSGTDAPHGILYIGEHRDRFNKVFQHRGFTW